MPTQTEAALPWAIPGKFLEMEGPSKELDVPAAIALAKRYDWKTVLVRHQGGMTTIILEHKDGKCGGQMLQDAHLIVHQGNA
jgi:hypothetical protein